jgi:type I restriction enzyme S subunit
MDGEDLPPGWAWACLDELGFWTGGGTPSKAKPEYWNGGSVPWVSPKDMKQPYVGKEAEKITTAAVENSAAKMVRRGSLLCVIRSGILNHTFPVAVADCNVTINQDMRALTTHPEICTRYVGQYLTARNSEILHTCAKDGTTVASIEMRHLQDLPVPIAPAAEQTRIADAVDALFTELDEAEAALARAREGVAQFRASLLHAACTGQLTAAWRAANPPAETGADLLARILAERRAAWERTELTRLQARGTSPTGNAWKARYVEPAAPDLTDLPELPEGWAWASLPQLGQFGRGKSRHRPRGDVRLYGDAMPFIQTGDVSRSGGRISSYSQKYSPLGVAQSRVWPKGTVCITIAANIAASGIMDFEGCFPDSVVGLTCTSDDVASYIEMFIRTARANLEEYAPATAQKNINLETLNALAVPIPPLAEMKAVLAARERAEDAIESLPALQIAELRQSILHAAFTGRLVPQDPDDEPAAALLARLRATAAPARRTRRTPAEASA